MHVTLHLYIAQKYLQCAWTPKHNATVSSQALQCATVNIILQAIISSTSMCYIEYHTMYKYWCILESYLCWLLVSVTQLSLHATSLDPSSIVYMTLSTIYSVDYAKFFAAKWTNSVIKRHSNSHGFSSLSKIQSSLFDQCIFMTISTLRVKTTSHPITP